MLQKIPITELRVGMYLHGLEGSWLKHPFWRTKFLISSEAELAKLRACGLSDCWIDPSRGLAPSAAASGEAATAAMPLDSPATALNATALALASADPCAFNDELDRAAKIIHRARDAVRGLLDDARLGKAIDKQLCLPVVEEITQSIVRHHGALISLLRLKRYDEYGYLHSVAVCALMVAMARELRFSEEEVRQAGLAGLLHDVGKATVPQAVLLKPGVLDEQEFAVIQTHVERGHALLLASGLPKETLDACLYHHERMDGSGYPHKLKQAQIPVLARMVAICDVYDAVTSNRPYKNAWSPADAIAQMASWPGQFDPSLFSALVRCLGLYPTGSLVRLNSGRLAVVMEQNPGALSQPVVRVFFCTQRRSRVSPQRLDLSAPDTKDHITARESPEGWALGPTDGLWGGPSAERAWGADGAGGARAPGLGIVRG